MRIKDEKIEIRVNDKVKSVKHLNRGYQREVFYFENEDIQAEEAQGKTKPQAKAAELQREAITHFNRAAAIINELSKIDIAAAEALVTEVYSSFAIANAVSPNGRPNLKSLERRAAAIFFADQDALGFVSDRAGIDYAQLLMNICFQVQDNYESGQIKAEARTGEALRVFKETKEKAAKEDRRELSPEGRAIFDALEAADAALEKCSWEEAEKIMEDAEAPLNALALRDPEEATRIFKRSNYFDEEVEDYEVYLGARVICRRDKLLTLDTPEKRAAYVKAANEDEDGAGDLPSAISGGEAVKLDGGEPVKLEGFAGPFKLG